MRHCVVVVPGILQMQLLLPLFFQQLFDDRNIHRLHCSPKSRETILRKKVFSTTDRAEKTTTTIGETGLVGLTWLPHLLSAGILCRTAQVTSAPPEELHTFLCNSDEAVVAEEAANIWAFSIHLLQRSHLFETKLYVMYYY